MSPGKQKIDLHVPSSDLPTGIALLRDRALNKGTAFTEEERNALGLRGLLPPHVCTQDEQAIRVMENYRRKTTDLERYIHLMALQDRNETLFYRVLGDHLEEMMPIVYTPTVGQACLEYGHIYRRSRGIFITAHDRGQVADVLRNWPYDDVRIIVVTDGERILGLGDLGADGMGIPVGKLSLYTACAGIHPSVGLPVTLDVGTDNEELLNDPLYIGLRQRRLRGDEYDALLDEFFAAAPEVFPDAVIQMEDFGNANAFRLLHKYRDQVSTFNDDMQGTGAVVLGGLWAALRFTGAELADQKFLFLGAGEAGIGIAGTLVAALVAAGMEPEAARQRCWFVDSAGLVVASRQDLSPHKRAYAHQCQALPDVLAAVDALNPTVLIGACGQAGAFTRPVLEAMARYNERPIVLALSNPTSKSECTADEAYGWTEGRALFASGSPFAPTACHGRTHVPGQANNAYIFPGVGLGLLASRARRVTDEMFLAAARELAAHVADEDLERGLIYPPLRRIRDVSAHIGAAVADVAYRSDLAGRPRPADVLTDVEKGMYEPVYQSYL